jgi:protein CpxP
MSPELVTKRRLVAAVFSRSSRRYCKMSPEKQDAVTTELKRFAEALNLSDSQKEQLRSRLADRQAKLQEFRQQNPNIQRKDLLQRIADMRSILRNEVVKFLTPEQLEKWDAEVARAKVFLGHSTAA